MALRRASQQCLGALQHAGSTAAGWAAGGSSAQAGTRRLLSYLPEDIAEAARRAKFPTRRPQPPAAASSSSSSSSSAGGSAAAEAAPAVAEGAAAVEGAAATAGPSLATGASQKEAATLVSAWMFPWERRQMEGGKLRPWEKLYWGVFVAGMALFLFNRLPKEKEEEKVDEGKEERKRAAAQAAAVGGSLIEGEEDPFDGLAPEEIQRYVEEATGRRAGGDDAFEGMSPDEINAYIAKHGMPRGAAS
eukprot:scaffold10.g2277.t1